MGIVLGWALPYGFGRNLGYGFVGSFLPLSLPLSALYELERIGKCKTAFIWDLDGTLLTPYEAIFIRN